MTVVASACQRRKEIEWQTVKAKQRQVRMKNVTAISLASKAKAAPAIKLAVLMAFRKGLGVGDIKHHDDVDSKCRDRRCKHKWVSCDCQVE